VHQESKLKRKQKIKVINAVTGKTIEVDADAIRTGPIRHETISDDLLERVRVIYDGIKDFYGSTLEQFEIGFMRDSHPEKEIAVWERILVAMDKVTAAMPRLERKMVLRTLLAYSMRALSAAQMADPTVKKIIEIGEGR
jgi:hypothetical protein